MAGQGSARVTLKEIDLSQVRNPQQTPQGVPAAVVGTARKGPAFVPRTFANMQQFEEVFGSLNTRGRLTNSSLYGPLALNEWMRSAQAGTYLRVLGVGDGNPSSGGGRVQDAGFIVGEKQVHVSEDGTLGKLSDNPFANIGENPVKGRTHFLGCFMKDATGSSYLSDAGLPVAGFSSIVISATGLPAANDTIKLDVISGNGDGDGLIGLKTYTVTANAPANDIANHAPDNNLELTNNAADNGGNARTVVEFWQEFKREVEADFGDHVTVTVEDSSTDGDESEALVKLTSKYTGFIGNENVITFIIAGDNNIVTVNEVLGSNLVGGSANAIGGEGTAPVIRAVLMTPQGVSAKLKQTTDGATATGLANSIPAVDLDIEDGGLSGHVLGEITGDQAFEVFLNGHKGKTSLSCSFNPSSSSYFAKVLNTDPTKIEELGHYLYAWWDIEPSVAIPDGTGLTHAGSSLLGGDYDNMIAFCVTGEDEDREGGNLNYESFAARYQTAKTPWITSQDFGGVNFNLFRLHALDDGEISNGMFRLLISNLRYSSGTVYGRFDLALEQLTSNPQKGNVLVAWSNLSLDPDDRNYIARVIGDQYVYYNFELEESKQRLQSEGTFEVRNSFVRVEMSDDLIAGNVPLDALPTGFLSHAHLNTAVPLNFVEDPVLNNKRVFTDSNNDPIDILSKAEVSPLKFVKSVARVVNSTTKEADAVLAWGIKLAKKEYVDSDFKELSEISNDTSIINYSKYFPHFNNVFVEDTGKGAAFQNGRFSLEKIQIPDAKLTDDDEIIDWSEAVYRQEGALDTTAAGRFVKISKDAIGKNVRFLKFRCLFQGGFDGVNIFDKEKAEFTGVASLREGGDETGTNKYTGPTVMAYRRACDVLTDKSAVEFQVLALPGQRASVVTDHALSACEERFDALYLMDIVEKDSLDQVIESDLVKPHVRNTVLNFERRGLDSSFGAAYFPDVMVRRPSDGASISVPPSVGMLGVLSRNDQVSAPWFAPAGLNRGRLNSTGVRVQMNRDLLDELYDADINPIYEPAGRAGEVYAFGQKTLMQDSSALDRINVRRLLIDIRRKVKRIGESLLFEPNRASTLARFSALVEPIMADVQKRQGVARYKVQIDSSTTTQNDIENNTIRGKIYLQPLKSIEFISLDFVVANTIE